MIKILGDPGSKRWIGDTAGLVKLQTMGMVLRYEVATNVPEYAVSYQPRSKRDPMPWVQVGGLESRLRAGEIVAIEADAFAAWEAEAEAEADKWIASIDQSLTATPSAPAPLPKCIHGRHQYKTLRGATIPRCESGDRYGVWDDNDAGFVHVVDCAQDAATWAQDELYAEPDYDLRVMAVCPDHEDQPAYGCEECNGDGCGAVDTDDVDACGKCRDCNPEQYD